MFERTLLTDADWTGADNWTVIRTTIAITARHPFGKMDTSLDRVWWIPFLPHVKYDDSLCSIVDFFTSYFTRFNTCSARKRIKRFLFFNTQLFFDTFFPWENIQCLFEQARSCANVKKMRSLLSVLHTSRKQNQCAHGAHQQVQKICLALAWTWSRFC